MEVRHDTHSREAHLVKGEARLRADLGIDLFASLAAGFATALFTYLGLRAARVLMTGDLGRAAFEVEAEAGHAHRPIEERIP